jgi:misacylated tRNA(Ala) deacylase
MVFKKTGALIGSGRVSVDRSYLGFTLENMDRALIERAVEEAHEAIERGAPVKTYFMKREEALKIPEIVKLAGKLPPAVEELRIIEIEGIDRQACGGPHVANIREIGRIEVIKMENKGKNNRRIYFRTI